MNVKGSRLRIGLVTGALLLVFAAMFVGSARATTPPATPVSDPSGLPASQGPFDPLSTNVPYLAWRGELVRLVGCLPYDQNSYPGDFNLSTVNEPNSPINGLNGSHGGLSVQVDPYAFSGPEDDVLALPKPVSTPNAHVFFDYTNDRICVRSDWISDKPGILIAKLTVSYGGVVLIQRDFMVGWMAINSATMTNAGTVNENPGTEPGNSANVVVTGAIPLNAEFQSDWGLTPGTCSYNGAAALPSSQTWQCLVMPRDWALWAQSGMASANMPYSQYDYCAEWSDNICVGGWVPNPYYNTDPSAFWDIHDSSAPAALGVTDSPDVHVLGFCNTTGTVFTSNIDQVDNCNGGEDYFSRLFGDSASGVGPFDPAFASTLLSDGRLNAADAPMPALQIIYNTSGGMGYFDNSCLNDKDNAYNRQLRPDEPQSRAAKRHPARPPTASRRGRTKRTRTPSTRRTTRRSSRPPRVTTSGLRPGSIRHTRRTTSRPSRAGTVSTTSGRSPTRSPAPSESTRVVCSTRRTLTSRSVGTARPTTARPRSWSSLTSTVRHALSGSLA